MVIEAGDLSALVIRVEAVDEVGDVRARVLEVVRRRRGFLVADATVRLVAVDGTVVQTERAQHLAEELHVALMGLLGVVPIALVFEDFEVRGFEDAEGVGCE